MIAIKFWYYHRNHHYHHHYYYHHHQHHHFFVHRQLQKELTRARITSFDPIKIGILPSVMKEITLFQHLHYHYSSSCQTAYNSHSLSSSLPPSSSSPVSTSIHTTTNHPYNISNTSTLNQSIQSYSSQEQTVGSCPYFIQPLGFITINHKDFECNPLLKDMFLRYDMK